MQTLYRFSTSQLAQFTVMLANYVYSLLHITFVSICIFFHYKVC